MVICLAWAIKLSRKAISDARYIKATTTSRVMVWFWLALGATAAVTSPFGIDTQDFMPLFEDSLNGFIGIGSILLTAGPAYAEYKEAQHAGRKGKLMKPALRAQFPAHPQVDGFELDPSRSTRPQVDDPPPGALR
jgi:hypothetical protein